MTKMISVSEFNTMVHMLNSNDGDHDIAIENIINLNLSPTFIKLMAKKLNNKTRHQFISNLVHKDVLKSSFMQSKFDFDSLYNDIVDNNADECIDIFEDLVSNHILDAYKSALKYDFIKTVNIKVT